MSVHLYCIHLRRITMIIDHCFNFAWVGHLIILCYMLLLPYEHVVSPYIVAILNQ